MADSGGNQATRVMDARSKLAKLKKEELVDRLLDLQAQLADNESRLTQAHQESEDRLSGWSPADEAVLFIQGRDHNRIFRKGGDPLIVSWHPPTNIRYFRKKIRRVCG